jgi:DNA polymerase type B, organellar and viral
MPRRELTPLVIAVRAYPDMREEDHERRRPPARSSAMMVFDTESRIDATQRFTFGSYRFIENGNCLIEKVFYGDDLPAQDRRTLKRYVDAANGRIPKLGLLTRHEFVNKIFNNAYRGRCLLVAFNFPFDISRVACHFANARGRFAGGFSFDLWRYMGGSHRFRPSISIKQIDSKRALKRFTRRKHPDEEDLIPEGSTSGKPKEEYTFRGHFLDLRTLAFALTDRSYNLERACEDFGVEHPKQVVKRHGIVTKKYIDYNRNDVLATAELAAKLLEEYDKHDIELQETKAYSPASIGKAYLRRMGIEPILKRQPNFPKEYLGYAQSAFFGGRTSAHVRKIPVPVVYTDFRSMYPTVNSLMGLWRFVIAQEIKVVEHCTNEIQEFLSNLTANDLFVQAKWKLLTAFVRVIPDGDILPARAKYNIESNDWQVGVNHLYADAHNSLWFSLPDVAASVLLNNGRVPTIIDAFRIEPRDTLSKLKPVKLRRAIKVDPRTQDFFKVAIEERQRLSVRTDLSDVEKERLDKALKVLANAASYGIYAEMNRQESEQKVNATCYGIDAEPFTCRVAHPDVPGAYCFPPLASLITGAARLMLALLENSVEKLGGTYAMEDTDSMAIVATEHGGSIKCGSHAINALSWTQVDEISKRFADLNPYERDAVPGSILKIEEDNRDPVSGEQRQLYCYAISAKRYALFVRDVNDDPVLLRGSCPFCGRRNDAEVTKCKGCQKPIQLNNEEDRWSEHGLGHLLNPTDPENEDREWIAQAWLSIIRNALVKTAEKLTFDDRPAVGRVTVSSPAVMRPLKQLNEKKRYVDQIKPFNFLLSCQVKPLGHPPGVDAEHFHLIAPYESDARRWLKQDWIDQYSGKPYKITTVGHYGNRYTARVKTYGDVLTDYEYHAESKCADANGKACGKQTKGLLERRHIRIDQLKYIGKESNSLEEVEAGLIPSAENAYTEYVDLRRDEWETKLLPALRNLPTTLLERETKIPARTLRDILAGRSRPHRRNQERLFKMLYRAAR